MAIAGHATLYTDLRSTTLSRDLSSVWCEPVIYRYNSPLEEQLSKVATWWVDREMMGQVVTEPRARVGEVWNGSRLQGKEWFNKNTEVEHAMFRQVLSDIQTECTAPNLRVDQFHQLVQRLFSSNPGIEHAGNIFGIGLKGPW